MTMRLALARVRRARPHARIATPRDDLGANARGGLGVPLIGQRVDRGGVEHLLPVIGLEAVLEQARGAHAALAGGSLTKHDCDQPMAVARCAGNNVETRVADEAGL